MRIIRAVAAVVIMVLSVPGCRSTGVPEKQVLWMEKSIRFRKIEYYAPRKTLRVFEQRTFGVEYKDVPLEVYNEFVSSKARGKYYDEEIKGRFESRVLSW